MVERFATSIFAVGFIYFLMWSPAPTLERLHLQSATAVSLLCPLSWPGASNCKLPSRIPSPAVLGLTPAARETKEKPWTRSENCLPHQVSLTLACALISLFAAVWSLGLCGSLVLLLRSLRLCRGCSIHFCTQLHDLTVEQFLGLRPRHKEQ